MSNSESQNPNIVWHHATVTRKHREILHKHKSFVLWFTGLSGAGKSTLAHATEEKLHQLGCSTYVFDGDNVRHGLSKDLSFSIKDRQENIRRIGEMVKLFVDAGTIALTAFISPLIKDRQIIRNLIGSSDFIEIYCQCSLKTCEQRDVKGMYKKARNGEITEFTGISSPYEEPENPEIHINTDQLSLEDSVDKIIKYLRKNEIITKE